MAGRFAAWCIVALLCAAAPAEAAGSEAVAFSAEIQVQGTALFQGESHLTGESIGFIRDTRLKGGEAQLTASFEDARVQVLDWPYTRFVVTNQLNDLEPLPRQTSEEFTFSGDVDLVPTAGPQMAFVLPATPEKRLGFQVDSSNPLDVSHKQSTPWVFDPFEDSFLDEPRSPFAIYPQGQAVFLRCADQAYDVADKVRLVVFGGDVHLDGSSQRTIPTGDFLLPGGTSDPLGMSRVERHSRIVLLIEGEAKVSMSSPGDAAWAVAASEMQGTLSGDLALSNVDGGPVVDGKELDVDPALLQAIGSFNLDSQWTPQDSTWKMDGTATFVGIDAVTVSGDRNAHRAAFAVAVGAVGLLAILLWLRPWLLAGFSRTEPLEHPLRQQLLDLIRENPGTTETELADKVGKWRNTVHHHVQRLQRAGLIVAAVRGNARHYTINHGAYAFELHTAQGVGMTAAEAFASTRHPVRHMIIEALQALPDATWEQLKRHWEAAGVEVPERRTFSYHANLMLEAGLVSRTRAGTRMVWRLAADLSAARAKAYAASAQPATAQPGPTATS